MTGKKSIPNLGMTIRTLAKESRKCEKVDFEITIRALKKEYMSLKGACQILKRRHNLILDRHKSFPDELKLARWTVGKMRKLNKEVMKICMKKLLFESRNLALIHVFLMAQLDKGPDLDFLAKKQAYQRRHEGLVELLKRVHKLMESALGSKAA